jgi:hypothetical protein
MQAAEEERMHAEDQERREWEAEQGVGPHAEVWADETHGVPVSQWVNLTCMMLRLSFDRRASHAMAASVHDVHAGCDN